MCKRNQGTSTANHAAHDNRSGLVVDEYRVFVAPIIVGGGNPYLPGNVRVELELLDRRGFDNGMVLCEELIMRATPPISRRVSGEQRER